MTKLTKTGLAFLMVSTISVSTVPSAFAGGGGCAVGGAIGLIAGSFVGGNAGKYAPAVGGLIGCGAGHAVQEKGKAHKGGKNSAALNSAKNGKPMKDGGKARSAAKQTNVASTIPKAKVAPVADQGVLEAQKNLAALGYNQVGKPDGFTGKGTSAAVKAFQAERGIPATGTLDAGLMAFIASEAVKIGNQPSDLNSQVADTNEMTQDEYIEAVRSEGAIVESDELQKASEPVKTTNDQPVGLAMAPTVNKSALIDTSVETENSLEADPTSDVLKNDLFN